MTHSAALVLSGGGALGAAHLGAIEVLQARGASFDFYAGASAGAIVCALLACGLSSTEAIDILLTDRILPLAFDFSKTRHGLISGKKVYHRLAALFGNRRFSDLSNPLLVGATDFQTGERVTISEGSIVDALRASLSVPVIFEPYFHPSIGRWLVDGGLTQNYPLDLAICRYNGRRIYGCDVCSSFDPGLDFSARVGRHGFGQLKQNGLRALRIMFRNQQLQLPKDPRVIEVRPVLPDVSGIDIRKMADIVERGRRAAEAACESAGI